LYLSGNTIDLGGTKISRDANGGGIRLASETGETVDSRVKNLFADGTITASNLNIVGDYVTMRTTTSNTEMMVIENAGTGPALKVTQTGTNSIAEFYDDGGVLALTIADGGNVGIGTSAPLQKLHVVGTVQATGFCGSGALVTSLNVDNVSSGNLAVAYGGTNIQSYTVGDLIYATGATALSKLADVATGNALISGGVGAIPEWGKIGLTTHVSGTLGVGNGGTGATTLAANKVLVGNGTTAVLQPTNLHWDDANSRLGIGTAMPLSALHVNGTTRLVYNSSQGLHIRNETTGSAFSPAEIYFDRSLSASTQTAAIGMDAAGRNFFIWVNGSDKMNITTNGNVGIGMTNPSVMLEVNGVIKTSVPYIRGYFVRLSTGTIPLVSTESNRIVVSNSTQLYAPINGRYIISFNTLITTNGIAESTGRQDVGILLNGNYIISTLSESNGTGWHHRAATITLSMTTSDNITFIAGGGTIYNGGDAFDSWRTFSMIYIG
jgi:hypothetical protein